MSARIRSLHTICINGHQTQRKKVLHGTCLLLLFKQNNAIATYVAKNVKIVDKQAKLLRNRLQIYGWQNYKSKWVGVVLSTNQRPVYLAFTNHTRANNPPSQDPYLRWEKAWGNFARSWLADTKNTGFWVDEMSPPCSMTLRILPPPLRFVLLWFKWA